MIVTGGYFAAEIPLMGYETALVSLISSPIQWCMSMVASAIIVPILIKNRKRIDFTLKHTVCFHRTVCFFSYVLYSLLERTVFFEGFLDV